MKPLDILSALPVGAKATPDAILDSPAFALPCRLGDESVLLRPATVEPAAAEMIALAVTFGDEPHTLRLARSPRFPELDKIWDARADVPEAILLALVERDCGPLFQLLENAVRRQMRLVGLASLAQSPERDVALCASASLRGNDDGQSVCFSLTRSATVVAAFGVLRNLDLSHDAIRSHTLTAAVDYAAFALSDADRASLAPGDAVLLPEIGTVAPRLVVDGRFVIDDNGVQPFAADALAHVRAAEDLTLTLGAVFDATETPPARPTAPPGAQLRLLRSGKTVATGRLDRVGEQSALIVEATL